MLVSSLRRGVSRHRFQPAPIVRFRRVGRGLMIGPSATCPRHNYGVGTRDNPNAAQWLAYALPCRRFVADLATGDARLGADAVRYSFIVSDFHRLLLCRPPGAQLLFSLRLVQNAFRKVLSGPIFCKGGLAG
jgi:hypothetical protein